MEYTEKYTEQHFIDFKEQLVFLAQEHFNACNVFIGKIEEAKTTSDIACVFEYYADDIHDKLGGTDYEDEIEELKDEIDDLKSEIDFLEERLETDLAIDTLHDEMKLNAFTQYKDKYTPWEFEQLLLNGKL
jgi:regulator of replication initiation timing